MDLKILQERQQWTLDQKIYHSLEVEGEYDESLVYDIMDKCDAMTTGIVYQDEEIKVEI